MPGGSPTRITAVDAHAAGRLVRVLTGGVSRLRGRTLADRARLFGSRQDELWPALAREPRGHDGVTLALLTEPLAPAADAGVLFFAGARTNAVPGEGLVAVTAVALEHGLIGPRRAGHVVFDTLAGTVDVEVETADGGGATAVTAARLDAPPARVWRPGVPLALDRRSVRADVAQSGEAFAIVDAETAGVPLTRGHPHEIRRAGLAIVEAARRAVDVPGGVSAALLTGPPVREDAQMTAVAVYADGTVDRGPASNALAALASVLRAMGLLALTDSLTVEGLVGATLTGHLTGADTVGDVDVLTVRVESRAWIVAEHAFVLRDDDPFAAGWEWGSSEG